MVVKKLLIAGAVVASLGTGTGVYAATTNHSLSGHKASQTQDHEGTFQKGQFHRMNGRRMKGGFLKEAAKTLKMDEKTLISKLKSGQSLADIAKAQGVPVATLKSNMEQAIKTKLDKAVKDGKLDQAKAKAMLSKMSKGLDRMISHKGLPKRAGWAERRMMIKGGFLKAAAKTLKMDEKTLISKLKSGQSLAEIAKAQGVPVATLKSNMEQAIKAKLDKAVKDGKLDQAKAKAMLSKMSKGLNQMINHKGFPKRAGWVMGRMGIKGGFLKETAKTLKMDEKTLISKLKSGQSLADIAKAQGVSVQKLKTDMQSALKSKLDRAVNAGKLSSKKEQQILSKCSNLLNRIINHQGFGHKKMPDTAQANKSSAA